LVPEIFEDGRRVGTLDERELISEVLEAS